MPTSAPIEIVVAHGSLEGPLLRYVCSVLVVLLGAVALLVGLLGIWRFASMSPSQFSVSPYLAWSLIGAGILHLGYHLYRLRHSFTARYAVTDTGIEISGPQEVTSFVRWGDFDAATVRTLFSLIELNAPALPHPIALFHSVGQLRRYAILKEIAAQRLGERFRVKLC